jgi:hypothetical protein
MSWHFWFLHYPRCFFHFRRSFTQSSDEQFVEDNNSRPPAFLRICPAFFQISACAQKLLCFIGLLYCLSPWTRL